MQKIKIKKDSIVIMMNEGQARPLMSMVESSIKAWEEYQKPKYTEMANYFQLELDKRICDKVNKLIETAKCAMCEGELGDRHIILSQCMSMNERHIKFNFICGDCFSMLGKLIGFVKDKSKPFMVFKKKAIEKKRRKK